MKLKLSENQLRRLKIMYAFDLATRYYNSKSLEKAIFKEGLNPEWIEQFNVLRNWKGELENWQLEALKDTGKAEIGCFKIRKTKKGYIIYTELARVKE